MNLGSTAALWQADNKGILTPRVSEEFRSEDCAFHVYVKWRNRLFNLTFMFKSIGRHSLVYWHLVMGEAGKG